MSLYGNVRAACIKNGISVMALEDRLGFPRSSICKWDAHTPSVIKVGLVADFLNVPIDELLKGEEVEPVE